MRRSTRANPPTLLLTVLLIVVAGVAAAAEAQVDLPIYGDRLDGSFEDWSGLPRSMDNTSPVHSGSFSIKVSPPANPHGSPVLWFHHTDLETAGYANITFWANGGDQGGQLLQMRAILGTNPRAPYPLPPLPTNEWRRFVVPLTLLDARDKTNLQGIWFQMQDGSRTDVFFLDDINLTALPAIEPIQRADTRARTSKAEDTWNVVAWCIAGALIAVTSLLGWLIVMLRRSGLGTSRALIAVPPAALEQFRQPVDGGSDAASGAKALPFEALADAQVKELRDKMAVELAEFAKQSLVQGLYSQRVKLLETQQEAHEELVALEARLASLQLPLQERIHAYELRIRELENELHTRNEEMRDLIQATLSLVRGRLEDAQAQEPAARHFN